MPKVHITIDVLEFSMLDGPTKGRPDVEHLVTAWLFSMSDAENEVTDPNTGEVIGAFMFDNDVQVRTEL